MANEIAPFGFAPNIEDRRGPNDTTSPDMTPELKNIPGSLSALATTLGNYLWGTPQIPEAPDTPLSDALGKRDARIVRQIDSRSPLDRSIDDASDMVSMFMPPGRKLGSDVPFTEVPFSPGVPFVNKAADIGSKLFKGAMDSVGAMVTGPGDLAKPNPYPEGSEGWYWYEDQRDKGMKDWSAGTALNLAGVNAPFAPTGAAGVFGGRLAATADQAALRTAEEMHAAGADRGAIWDKTGWFRGDDGKWRFEIPDDKAQMHPTYYTAMPSGRMAPVAGEIWHPELYQAYPDLRNATASVERSQNTASGSYAAPGVSRSGDERIQISAPNASTARSVGLHELQHAIQEREGFASGGSPAMFTQADDAALSRDALAWRREMERFPGTPREQNIAAEKAYREAGMDDFDMPSKEVRFLAMDSKRNPTDTLSRVVELYGLDKNLQPYGARDLYRSIPGEIEARNVQARRDMTPAERAAKPPWETEHFLDRVASSPVLNGMFGSRVGMLEK